MKLTSLCRFWLFALLANVSLGFNFVSVPNGTVGNELVGSPGPYSFDLDFDVSAAIVVTSLGAFDSGSDGTFLRNIQVVIYNRDSGQPVTPVLTFSTADPGTLSNGFRYKQLPAPVTLPAGFRGTVAAAGHSGQGSGFEPFGNAVHPNPPATAYSDGGGLITGLGFYSQYRPTSSPVFGLNSPLNERDPRTGSPTRFWPNVPQVSTGSFQFSSAAPPFFAIHPTGQTVDAGRGLTLTASVVGAESYQWVRNGVPISGATTTTLAISQARAADAGLYALLATNPISTTSSVPAAVSIVAPRLANLSVRSIAGAGDQTLIVGFVVGGSGQKQMLVRGIGPTLAQLGVNGALFNPQLRVFSASQALVSQNDDWGGGATLAGIFSRVGAFGLPAASRDAALSASLPLGSYTAQLTGDSGSAGVALVECYDADIVGSGATATLVNMSARNQVGTGDNILIAGFVISGFAPKTLLIRGIGPTLSQFGVGGVLGNPRVQLYNGTTLVAENDNWGGAQLLTTTFSQVGAFGLGAASLDAAMVLVLQPGSYTAQVSGVGGTTGVALLEVYDVP